MGWGKVSNSRSTCFSLGKKREVMTKDKNLDNLTNLFIVVIKKVSLNFLI